MFFDRASFRVHSYVRGKLLIRWPRFRLRNTWDLSQQCAGSSTLVTKKGNAVGEKGEEEILAIPAHLDSWTCKYAVDHVPGSAFGNRPQ